MGDEASRHPAIERLLADANNQRAFDMLGQDLSGSDLTSLLLEVFRERSDRVTADDVLRQYQSDRFVAPGSVDAIALARLEATVLEACDGYTAVLLAPVAPFGAHAALGQTPQNNVITTSRLNEVAADPTNSLALEAATRRAESFRTDPRSQEQVLLSAVQRVVRAQHFEGPRSFAHFSLLGLVCAGRDTGNWDFEIEALTNHVRTLSSCVHHATQAPVRVAFSAFESACEPAVERIRSVVESPSVHTNLDPDRTHGRGYYQHICFKLYAEIDGEEFELGDGGDVPWTQTLLQSRKERLVIGGLGLDRLAMLTSP